MEIVEAGVGEKTVTVSNSDINLIEMPDDIAEVHAAKGKKVSFEVRGKYIYLRTTEQSPFSLFVDCSDSVYSFLLNPKSLDSSQHIKIVDSVRERREEKDMISSDRFSLIRNIMSSMIGGTKFSGIIKSCGKEVIRSKDIEGKCTGIWEGSVTGIRYELRNIGINSVRLFEEDFWTPGVLAVAIDDDLLGQGESGYVYIVKSRSLR